MGRLPTLRDDLRVCARIRLYTRPAWPWSGWWRLAGEGRNIPVTVGLEQVQKLLWGDSSTPFGYIALGSGTTEPAASDEALESENADSRLAFTGHSISGGQAVIKTYFPPNNGNGNINEWGLFSAAAGGIMLNRGLVTPTVPKSDTEEMIAEVIFTVS